MTAVGSCARPGGGRVDAAEGGHASRCSSVSSLRTRAADVSRRWPPCRAWWRRAVEPGGAPRRRAADRGRPGAVGPVGGRLAQRRAAVLARAARHCMTELRVFGGVTPTARSWTCLCTSAKGTGVLALGRLTQELEDLLHAPVDVVPEDSVTPRVRDSIERDVAPLSAVATAADCSTPRGGRGHGGAPAARTAQRRRLAGGLRGRTRTGRNPCRGPGERGARYTKGHPSSRCAARRAATSCATGGSRG